MPPPSGFLIKLYQHLYNQIYIEYGIIQVHFLFFLLGKHLLQAQLKGLGCHPQRGLLLMLKSEWVWTFGQLDLMVLQFYSHFADTFLESDMVVYE